VVMTARHVVTGACRIKVRTDGRNFVGTRWTAWYGGGTSPSAADLATIKLDRAANDAFVFRVRSLPVRVGLNLGMVGYPLGNRLSLNQGKIIDRAKVRGAPLLAVRMLGAEGASGSPFIDDQGRVVGILQIGLGSKDVLGQRTSGVLVGLDLVRWWGPHARLDLCRAYPSGGIAGCPGATPRPSPPPTAAIKVTSAYLSASEDGSNAQTSYASVAGTVAYLQLEFASPVKGRHTSVTYSIDPVGNRQQQCGGSLGIGWRGAIIPRRARGRSCTRLTVDRGRSPSRSRPPRRPRPRRRTSSNAGLNTAGDRLPTGRRRARAQPLPEATFSLGVLRTLWRLRA